MQANFFISNHLLESFSTHVLKSIFWGSSFNVYQCSESNLIFYSQSKWVIHRHHSCILIYHNRFHSRYHSRFHSRFTPLQYYGWKTSFMHIDLPQSLLYIIITSRHCSCILIYHSHLNKLSSFTCYHLLNNMEEKHHSCIFTLKRYHHKKLVSTH